MSNRLAQSTSPYLLQHQDNPVDWYEWGEEAFAQARRLDRPVLLSVGYAACHWCHVMAHESFEDEATAALMNRHYVNVKVDREERPDVDAVYMDATTALTGHGGWPMTVFLTPQGKPFYAGTYFPPQPVHGLPAFPQLLEAVADSWTTRREEVEGAGSRIAQALGQRATPSGRQAPAAARLEQAVHTLARDEDREHGGFGGAPKFPPSMVLEFLLRHAAGSGRDADSGRTAAQMAERTLRAMAFSGTYDQVRGGFARYATDRAWVVPHFEKMLYDNALLARVYLHWWRLTGSATARRVALETCEFLVRDLGTDQGGFASSLDADTDGVEGLTYAWTPEQLAQVLGPDDGSWAADLLAVTSEGTFEHGTSTLQLTREPGPEQERWDDVRGRLDVARSQRPQPGRDDKVVAAWNGLAIAALAETGVLLERPDLVAAARGAAELLVAVHLDSSGRLRRVSRDGVAGAPAGVLEDHADVAEGLLALHAATGEPSWLQVAGQLLDTVLEQFPDGSGGFHDTAADRTDAALATVRRPQDPADNAYPSGQTAAAGALLSYAALTGSARHHRAAEQALGVVDALAAQAPRFAGWGLAVSEALLDGPVQVAVVGPADLRATQALHRAAMAGTAPGLVVSVGEPGSQAARDVPLLNGRSLLDGRPAAYVCRGFTCQLPTADPVELADQVSGGQVEIE